MPYVSILSVLISGVVEMDTTVINISAIISTNASQTLTTIIIVLKFAKIVMIFTHVHVKLEQSVTALAVVI